MQKTIVLRRHLFGKFFCFHIVMYLYCIDIILISLCNSTYYFLYQLIYFRIFANYLLPYFVLHHYKTLYHTMINLINADKNNFKKNMNTMKYLRLFTFALLAFCLSTGSISAQNADTLDVLHYNLRLDVGHQTAHRLAGSAIIKARLLCNTASVNFDLQNATVDSVHLNNTPCNSTYTSPRLSVPVNGIEVGDTFEVEVFYDTASYRLEITAPSQWQALCSGVRDTAYLNADNSQTSVWTLQQPIPTYLLGMAVGPFHTIERQYVSTYGTYPATIGYRTQDSASVYESFSILEDVVPAYERCFGPYRWDKIGYVGTPQGSMEHASNIALVNFCMDNLSEACQSTMVHELAHAWFGNLITCAAAEDMWFNEGGASFCEEVAMEAAFDKDYASQFYETNLEEVLRTTHITDGGYKPLYGQIPAYTYGSTVYNKGAVVWHSLRSYVGDSVFYASLRRLFNNKAFGNIDSYQLRDSLSLYTGVDLTDFFNFHVFSPGFVDYVIDSITSQPAGNEYQVTVALRQKLVGTTTFANSNRVPVTFFSSSRQQAKRTVMFNGEHATQTFTLPFNPVFAVPDYDREVSDAVTDAELLITEKQTTELPLAHFKALVSKADDTAFLHVDCHWTQPDNDENPEIVRTANRFWNIDGILPSGVKIRGFFRYGRNSVDYPNLDHGFYTQSASFDSIQLIYREDPSQPWRVISSTVSGNVNAGWFTVSSLKPGQYSLAVIDTALLAMTTPRPENPQINIFPNPSHHGCTVNVPHYCGTLDITIHSSTGSRVAHLHKVPNGKYLDLNLPPNTYTFTIKMPQSNTIITRKVVFN